MKSNKKPVVEEQRTIKKGDKEYNLKGMPKDMQDLYDDLVASEKHIKYLVESIQNVQKQDIAERGKHDYIASKLVKRFEEMETILVKELK